MELISFNSETAPVGVRISSNVQSIRFGRKGLIEFSKSAAEALGINTDSKIELRQDAKSKKNWYVCISEKGFKLRASKDAQYPIGFNSSTTCLEVFKSFPTEKNTIRLKLAQVPTEHAGVMLYGLLTIQ